MLSEMKKYFRCKLYLSVQCKLPLLFNSTLAPECTWTQGGGRLRLYASNSNKRVEIKRGETGISAITTGKSKVAVCPIVRRVLSIGHTAKPYFAVCFFWHTAK